MNVKRGTFRETSCLVIPAQAGIQWAADLDTGLRRCDEFHQGWCESP
jgi:hypothetical protein